MVRDLEVTPEGRVTMTFLLTRADPATLVREARAALKALDGIQDVKITVVDPSTSNVPPSFTNFASSVKPSMPMPPRMSSL